MFTPEIEKILSAYDRYSVSQVETAIQPDVKFDNYDRVHNWHNYIPYGLQEMWSELSEETRAALFVVAQLQADQEEWE